MLLDEHEIDATGCTERFELVALLEAQVNAAPVDTESDNETDDEKEAKLYKFLCELSEGSRVICFANTKRRAEPVRSACSTPARGPRLRAGTNR